MMNRELVWASFMAAALQGVVTAYNAVGMADTHTDQDIELAAIYADKATKEWEVRRNNGEFTGRVVE